MNLSFVISIVTIGQSFRMRDRHFDDLKRTIARSIRFSVASSKINPLPRWSLISLGANILLVALFILTGWRMRPGTIRTSAQPSTTGSLLGSPSSVSAVQTESIPPDQLGPRHNLTYDEWVKILEREAQAVVEDPPQTLSILMGDSISLWFPHDQLPVDTAWLNQGISGEVSDGLFKRIDIIAETEPDYIFVMIGINDLLRNVSDGTLLENQQKIVRELKQMHPSTTIVLQSILPHSADRATWEGKERLLTISNDRIRTLNRNLRAIADEEDIQFLDLAPLFRDRQGNLPMELSTDGLHLNNDGYQIWSNALQVYQQVIASNRRDSSP
ncbi:MAG: GDSL-type esterase/lipase family protein [Cyanobacteria bacterium P01_A01_bin.37]